MPKTYTTAGSAVAGDVYTASAHNVIVTDVNNFIVPSMCVTTGVNTAQSFAHATFTTVQFNGADSIDTDAIHDTVTNNTRFTCNTTGLYIVTFTAQINSTVVTQYILDLRLNATSSIGENASPLAASAARGSVSALIHLTAATDYIEARIYQESTGATARTVASARMSLCWIGRQS